MAQDRFIRHANLMSALTIFSRIAGLVRDKVLSYFLGVDTMWSAFWMGFQFPNLFRRVFGEGALTAVFLPAYSAVLHKEGAEKANKLASATLSMLVLILGGITLVGEAILVPIALSPGVTLENRFAAAMVALMLPYCIMVCTVALMGAIASVHEKFTAQSLSPIILALFMAGGAAASVFFMTTGYPIEKRIFWVAFSVLAAGVVQVLQMIPTLHRSGVYLRPTAAFRTAGMGQVVKPLLPILVAYSAVQINVFLDTQIAWWLCPDGHGGRNFFHLFGHVFNTAMSHGAAGKLSMAQRIYLLPVGIFGVSMATAIFPPMARAAADKNSPELKRLLISGLRKTLFLSIPASFGMILVAKSLITLVYLGGRVTPEDVDRAYWASIFFCLGIWAFEAQMVISRVYFVLKDTATPTKVALAMIGLNLALNLTLVWPLREGGIALSTTIAAVLQSAILLLILRKRLGLLGLRAIVPSLGKSLLATLVMIEIGWLLGRIPLPWETMGHAVTTQQRLLTALIKLPLIVTISAAVYFAITWFLATPELADLPLIGRLLKKRGVK
jgi:putative peptidoglycan lipid II flippase